jgi:N-acetylglucosamine malate deacetylase 1
MIHESTIARVLTIAAHPDDEILGCGGTMAAHRTRGQAVSILILGEGLTSRGSSPADTRPDTLADLQRDARKAASVIGVEDVTALDFPDNRFDSVPLLDVVKAIEREKARVKPDLVYVHHWGDLNVDHRVTFEAAMAAFRPLPGERPVAIYAYEVPSSTGWKGPSEASAFVPTHFVDVSSTLDKKIAAMETYFSERRVKPHPRSPESLRAWAEYRGCQVGVGAAEAFVTVRTVVTA